MKKQIVAILVIFIFVLALPVVITFHNLVIPKISNNKIDEWVDKDTGVVYLKNNNSITPKLDKDGKVMVKK